MDVLKPKFLGSKEGGPAEPGLFNYKKLWFISIIMLLAVSLVPLSVVMGINYKFSRESKKNENRLQTLRLTSNTRRSISFFLNERLDALQFIVQDIPYRVLSEPGELSKILEDLQLGFGGIVDLGLIGQDGIQTRYAGPYDNMTGKDYSEHDWFVNSRERGEHISEVFTGYRNTPHLIIAVKSDYKNGNFYVLRATLDIEKLIQILSSLELSESSEAFIVNEDGVLQTPSKKYGNIFEEISLPIPEFSDRTRVFHAGNENGEPLMIGYAYIKDTPFILMLIKYENETMQGWFAFRGEMFLLFVICFGVIVFVVLSISTFMVNKIYEADRARMATIEHVESNSRLISIGRLAAGVAHEINNPLAVISENAGLIKDMFRFREDIEEDPRMMELIDDVLESVDRCGEITKQLLGFARHFEPRIEELDLEEVISRVLSFLRKEASYRNIDINFEVPEEFPKIQSDRGKLQQIMLNLVNNSFQAMPDGGELKIQLSRARDNKVNVEISDQGCGISSEDLSRIFEPFFSTKGGKGGTGLGLSITHGLVRKLGGEITVDSDLGKGTTFKITLPIEYEGTAEYEDTTCG